MILTYGAKFADAWLGISQEKMKEHWAGKLGGYTPEEIARGIEQLDTRPWPPTQPEFLMLCRPPIEPMGAYAEACEKYTRFLDGETVGWSRPEIFWAAQTIGAWDLKNIPYPKLEPRWKDALANAARAPTPQPKKAIAETSEAHTDPESHADPEVRARVAEGLRNLQIKSAFKPMPKGDMNIDVRRRAAEADLAALEARRNEVM